MINIIDAHQKAVSEIIKTQEEVSKAGDEVMVYDMMYNAEVLDARVAIQWELMRKAMDIDTDLPREDLGLAMYDEPDGDKEEAAVEDGGDGGGGYVEEPELEEQIKNI